MYINGLYTVLKVEPYSNHIEQDLETVEKVNLINNFVSEKNSVVHHIRHLLQNGLNFPTAKVFSTGISMELAYKYMAILFNFYHTSNHLYPLQVENCDSNWRLVVDEDDNVKSGLKGLTLSVRRSTLT